MKHIAIFASGTGSNAEAIFNHFANSNVAKVKMLVCNKPGALVIEKAKSKNIPHYIIENKQKLEADEFINFLLNEKIDLIVLAGFLLLIPQKLIQAFEKKIINIHPSLLPKYGGKGMYGKNVHEAVLLNKENESGITIHYVNENFDEGEIINQVKCEIEINETVDSLQKKINRLELKNYPVIIEKLLLR